MYSKINYSIYLYLHLEQDLVTKYMHAFNYILPVFFIKGNSNGGFDS